MALRLLRSTPARRALSAAVFAAAAYLIWRQVQAMSLQGFVHALAATDPLAVAASCVFTVASYACLSGTEWLALQALGHRVRYRSAAAVAIPAYALTNSAGFSPATGTALRIELYRAQGLSAAQSTAVAMLAGAAVTLSGIVVAGAVLLSHPGIGRGALQGSAPVAAAAGFLMLAPAGRWFVAFRPGAPRWLGGGRSAGPSTRARLFGLAAGAGDWLFSGAAMFVLLPHPDPAVFASFFLAYTAGCILSAATGVPGGIGVFEAIVLALAGLFSQVHETAAALLLYRGIYSLGPLAIVGLYAGVQRLRRRAASER
jgi:phosphatidylglycerol lysyltransferase